MLLLASNESAPDIITFIVYLVILLFLTVFNFLRKRIERERKEYLSKKDKTRDQEFEDEEEELEEALPAPARTRTIPPPLSKTSQIPIKPKMDKFQEFAGKREKFAFQAEIEERRLNPVIEQRKLIPSLSGKYLQPSIKKTQYTLTSMPEIADPYGAPKQEKPSKAKRALTSLKSPVSLFVGFEVFGRPKSERGDARF
jgi:hypothetical protein